MNSENFTNTQISAFSQFKRSSPGQEHMGNTELRNEKVSLAAFYTKSPTLFIMAPQIFMYVVNRL